MDAERLASKHVVLVGIGHTNAHILRKWRMNPIPDADLTCVSDYGIATYSGMLPAALAGQIQPEEMEIDLVRLCSSASARLIVDEVCGLDHQGRQLLFRQRPPVPYDLLSIGIGSVPTVDDVEIEGESLLKIKPMQSFRRRLAEKVIDSQSRLTSREKLRVAVVGSGVAGIEILLCLSPFLRQLGAGDHELQLVTRSEHILPDVDQGTRNRIKSEIVERGFSVVTGHSVVRVFPRHLQLDNGQTVDADLAIWATGASAPAVLDRFNLPLDSRGFIATDHALRSTSGEPVFAVGDSGTIIGEALPKAGVYAVRQGPVLWENMQLFFRGERLRNYKPQRSFLKLINLGDGRAAGQWKNVSFSGKWAYWLKNRIDSTFMDKFRPVAMNSGEPMQCRGCGCKLGAATLDAALGFSNASAAVELEDAAEIGSAGGPPLLASTDFFSNPFVDAYLAGRVAAIHAASDILATGAKVTQALANVVVPDGDEQAQQRLLSDFLAGAQCEFGMLGAQVVGGHTIVGPRMEIGFTVIGQPPGEFRLRKSGLRAGDRLYLTKPLGIGVLLAAHMRSECKAADYLALIDSMLRPQAEYARLAVELELRACTDVTGFGLAGHLLEMLTASQAGASIRLASIPVLSGAEQAVSHGIESSLIGDNLRAAIKITAETTARKTPGYRLLFDPQTCGGLLMGVPETKVPEFEAAVSFANLTPPAHIGDVTSDEIGKIRVHMEQ